MVYVIFDGENKSGKSTLISELHKATGYKYSAIDRFSLTSYSFGKANKRKLNYKDYLFQDLNIWNEALLIFPFTDKKTLARRFKEHKETDINLEKDYFKMKVLYDEYLSLTPLKTIKINTSNSITDCVSQIKQAINDFENEPIQEKVYRLINFVNKNGDVVGNTKEVRNVVLKYNINNLKTLRNDIKEKLLREELPEYQEISASLVNNIRLKLHYFKNQDITSRQFIYTSESCISSFHVMKRNNTLEVTVYIRSSNLKKMLLLDIYSINWIAQKLNAMFFNCENISYNLSIGSAHNVVI